MFIRYFADTSDSPLGVAALEYMRSMMRVLPVRLVSVSGPLSGRWVGYTQLLITPMLGDFVNCVCCDPSRWTWMEKVPASSRPVDVAELVEGDNVLTIPVHNEVMSGRVELYTHGKRNVLFAAVPPRSKPELATALHYQALVVPSDDHADAWLVRGAKAIRVIQTPVVEHKALSELLVPTRGI